MYRPHTWLSHHASQRPDQVALLTYPDVRRVTVTWRELAASEARLIEELGAVDPGSCVALDLPNGARFLAALAACDALGLVPAPLHRRWAALTRARALELLGARAIIHEEGITTRDTLRVMPALEDDLRPACILFTSGSTGEPRGVPLSHRNMTAVLGQFERALALSADHVLGAIAPWYHVAGLCTMTLPLWRLGARIVCFESFDVDRFASAMRAAKIDATFMVPTMWEALRQSPHFALGTFDTLQIALTGGARTPVELMRAWLQRGVSMTVGYGMTEAAPMVTLATPSHWLADPLSVGAPDPEVEVKLLAREHSPAQILVRGPNVARCYLGATALEQDRWDEQGFFLTRDFGEWNQDGSLRYLGRADDVIVSGGEKISPVEVEAAIEQIDGSGEHIVVGIPDSYWGERVTLVSLAHASSRTLAWWREALDSKLERYKVPRALAYIEVWPLGATGKIDRAALRAALIDSQKETSR